MPGTLVAQRTTITVDVWEPQAALAKLASGQPDALNAASAVIGAAFREDVIDRRFELVRVGNYNQYTAAERQELLDGIERIARGEVQGHPAAVSRAIATAFSILTTIGLDPTINAFEKREIPRRFLRIYHESERRVSKTLAINRLGDLLALSPPESKQILEVLAEVATAPFSPDRVHPQAAVDALINSGAQGIATLRGLHENDVIQDPMTRAFVREYARRGFPPERRGVGPRRNL